MLDVANIGFVGGNLRSFFVDFLTRQQCGLCRTAAPVILRVAVIARAEVSVRDVTTDDELFDRYEHRIPVVLGPDGRVLAEGQISFWALLGSVLRARARWAVGSRQ
ncbi:MAG: glutaredoxin family protein [Acidimicrobiia bacterium]|nr:glutaredoxin family protein [Acidimicrobiia bacterium]